MTLTMGTIQPNLSLIISLLVLFMFFVSVYLYLRTQKLKEEFFAQNEELKKALYQSQIYEQQLRELIDLIPYPVFSKDQNQNFITVNEAYAQFFGLTPKDIEGKEDLEIYKINAYTPMSRFRVIEAEVLQKNQKMHLKEYLLTDVQGVDHIYDIRKVPYPIINQKEMGLLSIAVDITDFKRKENQRISALTRLVTNITHLFNTPLGNIISSSSFLKMQQVDTLAQFNEKRLTDLELKQFLDSVADVNKVIELGLERLVSIVNAFKSLSISTENLVRTNFNLLELIQGVVEKSSSFKKVAWEIHFNPSTQLNSYHNALEQVLCQVVNNATIHGARSPQDGQEHIDFYYYTDGDYAILHVCDNGPGISEANLSRVFDPLFTSAQNYGHLGIGLSIAYNVICQLLDGDMEIKNRLEGGLEVIIKFRCH